MNIAFFFNLKIMKTNIVALGLIAILSGIVFSCSKVIPSNHSPEGYWFSESFSGEGNGPSNVFIRKSDSDPDLYLCAFIRTSGEGVVVKGLKSGETIQAGAGNTLKLLKSGNLLYVETGKEYKKKDINEWWNDHKAALQQGQYPNCFHYPFVDEDANVYASVEPNFVNLSIISPQEFVARQRIIFTPKITQGLIQGTLDCAHCI